MFPEQIVRITSASFSKKVIMPNPYLHQITHWQDPNLPNVLDIYQASFPPNEQMRLSWWVRLLNELSLQNGPVEPEHLLYAAVGDDPNDVIGFAYCEVNRAKQLAYLMYFAMREDVRGQGIGAAVYRQLTEEILVNKNAKIIVFEVEKPEVMARESADAARVAERRIGWYERQGAFLLEGIHYIQGVGWQPAVEMALMFHSRTPISPEEAFAAAVSLLADNVQQTDALGWRPIS